MHYQVTCPQCRTPMRVNGQPEPNARIQCVRGDHVFLFGAGAPTPLQAVALPKRFPLVAVAVVAAILLSAGGIITALALLGGSTKETPPAVSVDPVSAAAETQRAEAERLERESAAREKTAKEEADKTEREQARVSQQKERDKQQQEFIRLMVEGGTALNAKQYGEAVTAYTAALRLFPDHKDATEKLIEARTGQAVAQRSEQNEQKRKEDHAKLLGQADQAMTKKQYAAAVEIYKLALSLQPGDGVAGKGLVAAQAELAKNDEEQKRLAKFEAHLVAGRAALKVGQYAEAVREFAAAQDIFPFSPVPAQLQRQAEGSLAETKDRETRAKELSRLLELGGVALAARRYDEAETHYRQALKVAPNDATATRGLAEAQFARRNLTIEFERLMTLGQTALRDGRLRDAVDYFREASRLAPGNDLVARALLDAERLLESQRVYVLAMRRGNHALDKGQLREAAGAFKEALLANPGDPLARDGLADAQRRLDAEARNLKEFERKVQAGVKAYGARKYAEARDLFNEALQLMPNHPQAAAIARQARQADALAQKRP